MQLFGIIVFMVAIILSRLISVRAYQQLNVEEKVRLMDGLAVQRMCWNTVLFIALGSYWILATQTAVRLDDLSLGYLVFLLLYVIVRAIVNRRTMRNIGLSPHFQHQYMLAQGTSFFGMVWLSFAVVY